MTSITATVLENGALQLNSGPVHVRCYDWTDVDQDEALSFETPPQRWHSERGHRFEGMASLDNLRVVQVERLGHWSALLLPGGSHVLIEAEVRVPDQAKPAYEVPVMPTPPRPADPPAPQTPEQSATQARVRQVLRIVLTLVALDILGG